MYLLEGFEFREKGIKGFEEFLRIRTIEINDRRKGKAEK